MQDDRKIKDIYTCNYIEADGEMYPLQKWYNRLLDKRISELEVSDILRMIRQNEFMDIAISKAVSFLKENPFVGDMYEGELLEKLSNVNTDSLTDYIDEIKSILSNALIKNQDYEWLDDEERKEFAEIITKFSDKVRSLTIIDKRQELLKKLYLLVQQIDEAGKAVDDEKNRYLNNYKSGIEIIIKRLQDGTLPASKGGLIGTMRGISEYDSLASIKALYDAASDVDLFYSRECQEW